MSVRILGTGSYLPRRAVSAEELDARRSAPNGSSFKANKVRVRHFADTDETSSYMASEALQAALKAAELPASALDMLIAVSVMAEQPIPTNAILVHRLLGLSHQATCFDVNASCLGFLQAVQLAGACLANGTARCIGIVASEIASNGLNWNDAVTCTLFGDGAAAAVLGPAAQGSQLLAVRFQTFSEGADHCRVDAGGSRLNVWTKPLPRYEQHMFFMDGKKVFRLAAEKLPPLVAEFLEQQKLTLDDIDVVIPHQASAHGLHWAQRALQLPDEKFVNILANHGNQVSVSMPMALHSAVQSGQLRRGKTALLLGTGAGLICAVAALRF